MNEMSERFRKIIPRMRRELVEGMSRFNKGYNKYAVHQVERNQTIRPAHEMLAEAVFNTLREQQKERRKNEN